ncbi:MAG: hypothetical protein WCX73_04680 [Candidatus Pacearchaeota archaeon]|jgi:hypothetical protein
MKKGLVLAGIGLFNILFLIMSISAGIYFSQPEQIYNLGEVISNDVTVDSSEAGFLKIDLVCDGDNAVNIFNGVPVEGKTHIEFPLIKEYMEGINGNCYFLAKQNNLIQESRHFKISNVLDIRLDSDSFFIKPGESIIFSGMVERLSGARANGTIVFSISSLDSGDSTARITDGRFSINFDSGENMAAGMYRIDAFAYEESLGSKTSEGISSASLEIAQILKGIEIVLNVQSLDPGQNFSFKPRLLDQTEQSMEGEISIVITDQNSNLIFEKVVPSEGTIVYNTLTNMSPGNYQIEASSSQFSETKTFYVNEKKSASIELVNGTLIITNTGNVVLEEYPVEIDLSGTSFVEKINLFPGEKQEFKLTGDGFYNVKVTEGGKEFLQTGVALTGGAIGVKDIKEAGSMALNSPIIWIFLIIILGGAVLFFFRNIFKKRSFAYPFDTLQRKFNTKSKVIELKATGNVKREREEVTFKRKFEQKTNEKNNFSSAGVNQAEKVLVLDGQKSRATVIILKIKNKLASSAKENLEKSIEHVYEKKAAVYEKGDDISIIFSPLMTRTFKNEIEATKSAEKIAFLLSENNRRFKEKIDFGIGINSGDIINKIEDKKLKFTALGNLIIGAKKLAEISDKQILISKEAYEKAMNEIKVVKKETKNGEIYEVQKTLDREKNKDFIKGFLGRMEKDNKNNQNQRYSGQGM